MHLDDVVGRTVSRETVARMEAFSDLVKQWTTRINLVAPSTLDDIWLRHILDSAQVYALKPPMTKRWVDLGSGGGFPGLVVAIVAADHDPDLHVVLVESDQRKCAFLRTVLRETGIRATVIARRIDQIDSLSGDVVSARALAALPELLMGATRHLAPGGIALLPKGARWREELEAARKTWSFTCVPHPSKTEPDAAILQIGDIAHV